MVHTGVSDRVADRPISHRDIPRRKAPLSVGYDMPVSSIRLPHLLALSLKAGAAEAQGYRSIDLIAETLEKGRRHPDRRGGSELEFRRCAGNPR